MAAAACGGLIGFEREFFDQPAGFRTHILVALGAALFTLVGVFGVEAFDGDLAVRVDPTRIAAQVVTGIGFLGAGAIIQQGFSVRGLTTAASLWVTAAIGTAMGLGYYFAAFLTGGITLVALLVLKPVEQRFIDRLSGRRHRVDMLTDRNFRIGDLRDALDARGMRLGGLRIEGEEEGALRYIVTVHLPRATPVELALTEMRVLEGVLEADVSG